MLVILSPTIKNTLLLEKAHHGYGKKSSFPAGSDYGNTDEYKNILQHDLQGFLL